MSDPRGHEVEFNDLDTVSKLERILSWMFLLAGCELVVVWQIAPNKWGYPSNTAPGGAAIFFTGG